MGALVAEGRRAAPATLRPTAFCRAHGVETEGEFKLRCRSHGKTTYHMHLGLTDWPATRRALAAVHGELAERGHRMDRFGLCLSRSMSVPEARRSHVPKETGPRLERGDWDELGDVVPIQPHLGDYMIGTPAGLESTTRALAAGITTIGNLGQYFAFETPGGADEVEVTATTVRALGALGAFRSRGALVHSYLDDGPAMQFAHYGAYAGWAALELYVVEDLIGARLAHCYGGLVPDPAHRAILGLALDDVRGRDSLGSMVYGNTVDYTRDHVHNEAVLAACLLVDIAVQLHRPTGHAVTPVPLTESERVPSAREIVDVHLLARELEAEARRSAPLYDWTRLERQAGEVAEYARAFRDRVLGLLEGDGVDVRDAGQVLLALRRTGPQELEAQARLPVPRPVAALVPWKAQVVRSLAQRIEGSLPSLRGRRVVLAVLEVHDVVRDAFAATLPRAGAEVVLVGASARPAEVAQVALDEDADAVVVGTYNGAALSVARELQQVLRASNYDGVVVFGGLLNEDMGGELPVDVTPQVAALGIHCAASVEDLGRILAEHAPGGGTAAGAGGCARRGSS